MGEAPPVVDATNPPLLYRLFQCHDSPPPAVGRCGDRSLPPTLRSLSWTQILKYAIKQTRYQVPGIYNVVV